jgi:hypothetical protein
MARYKVMVTDGRKVITTQSFDDYDQAMDGLDVLEDRYGKDYTVEFKDSRYFRR